jgi:hypothetical protein
VDAAASSDPFTEDALDSGTGAEDCKTAEEEGCTVVYSVLMMITRVLEVELAWIGLAVGSALSVDKRGEFSADDGRLLDAIDEFCAMDCDAAELATAAELINALVGRAFCDVSPGWLNPGRPVALPAEDLLLTTGVEEASGAPDSLSSGE